MLEQFLAPRTVSDASFRIRSFALRGTEGMKADGRGGKAGRARAGAWLSNTIRLTGRHYSQVMLFVLLLGRKLPMSLSLVLGSKNSSLLEQQAITFGSGGILVVVPRLGVRLYHSQVSLIKMNLVLGLTMKVGFRA